MIRYSRSGAAVGASRYGRQETIAARGAAMKRTVPLGALLLLAATLFGIHRASAQVEKPEIYKILSITVEGNQTAETGAIIANSGLHVGDEIAIPSDRTRQVVARLWALRIFSDVELVIENRVGNGIYLLIKVKEYPRLERVEFKGNHEFSDDDLKKKVTILKGQVVNPQTAYENAEAMRKDYSEKGYLNATVTTDTVGDPLGSGRVDLVFNIAEGEEVKVSKIEFTGDHAFTADKLKDQMDDTFEDRWWRFWKSAKFDPKKFKEDEEKVVKFYQKNGFRDAEILGDSLSYDTMKTKLTIHMSLYEGPKYYIRSIKWIGNTKYPSAVLSARLGLRPGDIYDLEKFEQNLRGNETQTDALSLYLDTGYLLANLEPEEQRVGADSMDIVIRVGERNQFRVGQVFIRGNTKTNDKVIRRELFTVPGDYFSRQDIVRSLRQLNVLNYFNPEKLKPDYVIAGDSTVNLTYEVEEKSSDTFNASIGYSAAYKFIGSIGLTFNNFSLTDPLSGGGGQVLGLDWQFGEANRFRTLSLSFTEPWFMDTPTTVGFSVYDTRQSYYGNYSQTGTSLHVGRRFRWPDYYFRGDWTIGFKNMDIVSAPLGYDVGKTTQHSISQVISRSTIDNPTMTTRGTSFAFSVELAGGPLLPGNINYQKYGLSIDWFTPLSERFTLYTGSQLGAIFGWGNELYVQWPDRYFMGGTGLGYIATTPLRGYDDRVIGPVDASGTPIGGRAMAKYTAELRLNVSQNPIPIYLLAFAEAGNVWDSWSHTSLFDLRRSAGVGARLMIVPIGLVGFDYGYGFDGVVPGGPPSGWKLHFQFGRGY